MHTPKRILVPIDDSHPDALGIPLAYANKLAKHGSPIIDKVVLLTHTKQQLRATSLARHLGQDASKALEANKSVRVGDSLVLRHETRQTLRFDARNAIIIVFYADDKLLEFVDGLTGVAGVVAVPWPKDGAKNWTARWTPHVHGAPAQVPAKLLSDPVIESALKTVSQISNLAHDVMHPRDKEHAEQVFRILRAKGHSAPEADIKSWAIREGWKPGAASELAKLATRAFALKSKPSLAAIHDPHGRYARWQDGKDDA